MTSLDIAKLAQDSTVTAMKNYPHQTLGSSTPTQTEPGSEPEESDCGTTTVHKVRTVTGFQVCFDLNELISFTVC
jgi:hypothetical protein